jgi:hypothetical protein
MITELTSEMLENGMIGSIVRDKGLVVDTLVCESGEIETLIFMRGIPIPYRMFCIFLTRRLSKEDPPKFYTETDLLSHLWKLVDTRTREKVIEHLKLPSSHAEIEDSKSEADLANSIRQVWQSLIGDYFNKLKSDIPGEAAINFKLMVEDIERQYVRSFAIAGIQYLNFDNNARVPNEFA